MDKMPTKQILIYAQYINGSGGISTWTHIMSQEFARRGHKVTLVARYESPHPIQRVVESSSEQPDITRIYLDSADAMMHVDDSARIKKLDTLLQALDKDAVIICAESPLISDIFSSPSTAQASFTVIAQLHFKAADLLEPTKRVYQKYQKQITMFQAVTDEDTSYMQQLGFQNTVTIPNPVAPPKTIISPSDRDKSFVLLGRLVDEKGIDEAVRAWCMVATIHPEWSLRIYGDGPLKQSLQTLISTLNLTHAVTLMGTTDHPLDIISKAYGVISSSLTEGMSMVVLEAMAHGTPVIAYDSNPGTRDVISDAVNGLLVQTGNIPDLTKAVLQLIENSDLHSTVSLGAHERAKDYSVEATVDAWEALLGKLA